jgi:hypothetical protein
VVEAGRITIVHNLAAASAFTGHSVAEPSGLAQANSLLCMTVARFPQS